MAIRIEQSRQIDAPVERVWPLMTDVTAIADCMPGAELTGPSEEGGYNGSVAVKIGPLSMRYRGRLEMVEALDDEHQVKFVGKGRDGSGSGTAQLNVTARADAEGDATKLSFVSEVQLTGRAAMLGRGVDEVAGVVLSEFLDNFTKLATDSTGGSSAERGAEPAVADAAADDPDVSSAPSASAPSAAASAPAPATGDAQHRADSRAVTAKPLKAGRLTRIVVGGWFRGWGRRLAGLFRRS